MNRTVYLAGAIYGVSYKDATEWRNQVDSSLCKFRWQVLNPMNGKESLTDSSFLGMEYDHPLMNARAIVDNDLFHVQQASVLLANLTVLPQDGYMTGTQLEIGYALALNKLVYIVAEPNSVFAKHPFIKGRCVQFPTLDWAIRALQTL